MNSSDFWCGIVFSDKKRFYLDGPDGTSYYWSDPRLEERYFSKITRGGDGVIIWAGICARGATPIVFVEGNMDGIAYSNMLSGVLMSFIEDKYISLDDNVLFQQDNAAALIAKVTQELVCSEGLDVLPWPAKSPDLNIVEDIRGWLLRRVYYGFRKFENVDDLKECITFEWEKLTEELIVKYVDSMPRHCRDVLIARGGTREY